MSVDGYGKHTPKIKSLMKARDDHMRGIFLTSRPETLQSFRTNLFECASGNILRGNINEKEKYCL